MKHFIKILFSALLVSTASTVGAHEGGHPGSPGSEHGKLCPVFFSLADVCAKVEFVKGPAQEGESQFLVEFFEHKSAHGEHIPVDPQELKIDLWMYMGNHGGHGSAPVQWQQQSAGVYMVTEAYFVMPGRWNVRFFVNGEQADLIVDVKP
ncbi:MAG: FixH family protein [Bdellovibrio sp.]